MHFFSSKSSSFWFLKPWKLLASIVFCHRQLRDLGCCMKGVSIGHCERAARLLIAFGVPGSWDGRNHRCSVPTRSGHCLFTLSHWQEPSPEESWLFAFYRSKTKIFELWEKGGEVPWKRCSCFRLTLFLLSPLEIGGGEDQVPQKNCVGGSQECIKFNLVPTAAIIFTPLSETGVQRKCEQLLFIWSMHTSYLGLWIITPKLN